MDIGNKILLAIVEILNVKSILRGCFSYTVDVFKMSHHLEGVAIRGDCKKYVNNPRECVETTQK